MSAPVVNRETGEITEPGTTLVVADKSSASVVTLLEQAKSWLATCVEMTGPAEIAAAKAQIVTAETYARELRLSKDIREDAAEMVRRAEWALRKATQKAQAEGEVASHGGNRTSSPAKELAPPPSSFFTTKREYEDANAVADLDEDAFEEVLEEAKSEGNLSRANVARKAREKSGKSERATPRRALPDQFFTATYDAVKKVESLHRLIGDDRFPQNAEKVAAKHRNDLLRTRDLLEQVINALPEQESTP